jgi:hypothetical protein
MPSRGFFVFGHEVALPGSLAAKGDESMSPQSWKRLGEVVFDVVAVAVAIATTALVEKLFRAVGSQGSSNDSDSDGGP